MVLVCKEMINIRTKKLGICIAIKKSLKKLYIKVQNK